MAGTRQKNSGDDLLAKVGELIDAKFAEREHRADRERKRKEDPWGALSDLIDERIGEARKRDVDSEDDDDDDKSQGQGGDKVKGGDKGILGVIGLA